MRYRAKVDINQPEVVKELRKLGFSVLCLHTVGKGCPDLLIGKDGQNYLVELKSDPKAKLTPDETDFFDTWQGQVIVAHSVNEILTTLKIHPI